MISYQGRIQDFATGAGAGGLWQRGGGLDL